MCACPMVNSVWGTKLKRRAHEPTSRAYSCCAKGASLHFLYNSTRCMVHHRTHARIHVETNVSTSPLRFLFHHTVASSRCTSSTICCDGTAHHMEANEQMSHATAVEIDLYKMYLLLYTLCVDLFVCLHVNSRVMCQLYHWDQRM